jgi:hypothetical protein
MDGSRRHVGLRNGLPSRYGAVALGSGLVFLAGALSIPWEPRTQGVRGVISTFAGALGLVILLVAGMRLNPPALWRRLYARLQRFALVEAILLTIGSIILFSGGAFMTLFIPFTRGFWSDVISFSYTNAHLVLSGHNPYISDGVFPGVLKSFPNALETPLRQGAFGSGYDYPSLSKIDAVRQQYASGQEKGTGGFDPRTLHSYPALSFLIYVPMLLLGIDNILILNMLVYWALFAWLLWLSPVGWRHWAVLALGAGLTVVLFSAFLETEIICLAFLLVAWHLRRSHWLASAILLGLACAFKQYCWFFVPFFVVDMVVANNWQSWTGWRKSLRSGLVTLAAFLAPNLPFIVASPGPWFHSLWLPMSEPLFPIGMGIVSLSVGHVIPYFSPTVYLILEMLALGAALYAFCRWRVRLAEGGLMLALFPLFFAFRSLPNYFAIAPWIAFYAATQIYRVEGVMRARPAWVLWLTSRLDAIAGLVTPRLQPAALPSARVASDVLFPAKRDRRRDQKDQRPDGKRGGGAGRYTMWRERATQGVGESGRWQKPREWLYEGRKTLNWQYRPADEQEDEKQPVGGG